MLAANGLITEVNAAWEVFAAHGDAPPQLRAGVGLNYLQACDAAAAGGDPLAAEAAAKLRAVLTGREDRVELEYPCHSPDEERWFIMQATRMPLARGGAVVAHYDITQRKRAEQARDRLVERLQASLLPRPTRLAGAEVLTHYRPGEKRLLLGGDFLDFLQLADGTIAAVIGDVVGHGPEAAALGAVLRIGWRALVSADLAQSEVLPALHQLLAAETAEPNAFATVCCMWIDPSRRSLHVANAGHPPPLLLTTEAITELPGTEGPLLTPFFAATQPVISHRLPPRCSVIAYTDGLVEGRSNPGGPHRFGVERFARQLHAHSNAGLLTEAVLGRVLADITNAHGGPLPDDQALLVVLLPEARQPHENHEQVVTHP